MKHIFQFIAISLIVLFTSCANAAQDNFTAPPDDTSVTGTFKVDSVKVDSIKTDSIHITK